jgi:hypothetical protein
MYFLLSGEGVADIGAGQSPSAICEGNDFLVGPMSIIVERIVEARHKYSILEGACGFVSERHLVQRADQLKAVKKQLRLPGKKQAKETRYFFNNARILARIAKEKAKALEDDVVAVLFRDADGTASAGRGDWNDKRESMLDGFDEEHFEKGVPMIPRPKSEAWLICALRNQAYQNCEALEERSGNDRSPNSLKGELDALLSNNNQRESLCEQVRTRFDFSRISMPSFQAFLARLVDVVA